MKWLLGEPSAGDMIRVKLGSIYHYGIYVADDEVIQFGLAPTQRPTLKDSEIEVLASDIDAFLCGGFLEVCEFDRKETKRHRSPEQVVAYAREHIGRRGYNILYNNCEHFANECISGVPSSSQADVVRAMFRAMPVVDVYIASIPPEGEIGAVVPPERDEEIRAVSNERVKREKYYAWRLLEYALERSFGLRIGKLALTRDACGRWSTPSCEISISHSGNAVAVAVSRAAVGVDIELPRALRSDRIAARVLTETERTFYEALPEAERQEKLIELWTAKEAVFKAQHRAVFEPALIDTVSASVKTDRITLGEDTYIYSVSTPTPERVRLFTNVDLSGR